MSYYFKYPYQFSSHGIQRCRERLRMAEKNDFEIKEAVMNLIQTSNHSFECEFESYIRLGTTGNLYLVVNKNSNLIITCTPISIEKQFSLLG